MKHNWLGGKTVEKEIDGKKVVFYKIPAGTIRKFKALSDCIGSSLSLIFDSKDKDSRTERIQIPSEFKDDEGALYQIKQVTDAIDPKIAEMRRVQMEKGIASFVELLTGPDAMDIACEIIGRSARDIFEDYKEDYSEIQNDIDIATMVKMLQGAWEASAGDFAEMGKSLFLQNPKIQDALDKAKQHR